MIPLWIWYTIFLYKMQSNSVILLIKKKKKKFAFVRLEAMASMYDQKLDLQFKHF